MKKKYFILQRTFSFLIIALLLMLPFVYICNDIVSSESGTTYYVSNDGNDSNSGTSIENPWKTIGKVVSEFGGAINTGDDIYFRRGDTFNDAQLDLELGGISQNPMIFGAYGNGAKPIFSFTGDTESIIYLDAIIGHIMIQDIHFTTNDFHCILSNLHSTHYFHHLTISRCDFDNLNGAFGIYLRCGEFYKIEDCTFDINNNQDHAIAIGGSPNNQISNGIIKNCIISGAKDGINLHYHDTYDESIGPNHLIEDCVISNWYTTESGIDISGGENCENILVRNCEIYNGNNPAISLDHGSHNIIIENVYMHDFTNSAIVSSRSENTIIRNCVIENLISDKYCFTTQQDDGTGKWTKNTYIYNNDFITDDTYIIRIMDTSQNEWGVKNNIFYSIKDTSPGLFVNLERGATFGNINGVWSHNLWWRGDGGNSDETWWTDSSGTYNFAQWNTKTEVMGDLRDDPKFENVNGGDFTLESNSPCIDAGVWLTTTNGGGSGKTIPLDEAGYFFEGISSLGVPGDKINIGGDTNLEITDVNYVTDTITVDRSISWSNGDPVSLNSYLGSAPDIGAYESSGSSGPDNTPPYISNINLVESNPLDTDESFGWIEITASVTDNAEVSSVMVNINCPDGSVLNVSMNDIGSNTYSYHTTTTFSNYGTYEYYIWAIDTNGNPSISPVYNFVMPPNWDIDMNGECNILDMSIISNHYNEQGQNGWLRCDVDNNGIIEVLDFVITSIHLYETW